jgi:AcrR family transcriptional regulator
MSRSPAGAPRPGGKRARTRARLIDAAYALFQEKGLSQTSVQDIAERAGVTTGSIYSCFENKNDLVIAVGLAKSVRMQPDLKPGRPLKAQLRALAEEVIAHAPAMSGYAGGVMELRTLALREEGLRARLAGMTEESLERRAALWTEELGQTDLPMPAAEFCVVIDALLMGLMIQRALTPELVTDEVILKAFLALG